MDYNDLFNATDSMMNTVIDAIERNDFSQLNATLRRQVRDYTNQVNHQREAQQAAYNLNDLSHQSGSGSGSAQHAYQQRPHNQTGQHAYQQRPGGQSGQYAYQQRPDSQQAYQQQSSQQSWQSGTAHQARKQSASEAYEKQAKQRPQWQGENPYSSHQTYSNHETQQYRRQQGKSASKMTPFRRVKPSTSNSTMEVVGGVAGLAFSLPSLLALGTGVGAIVSLVVYGGIAAASAFLLYKGNRDRKLVYTFLNYAKVLGDAEYFAIDDLAFQVGETPAETRKNLTEMMKKGLLPHARFDEKKTTMILTQAAYKQYQDAEAARKEREDKAAEEASQNSGYSDEVQQILAEGDAYIRTLHSCNEQIPDETMTAKLDRLERIVNRIFDRVRSHPEYAPDLRKFMNYYLPTTEKLLNSYIELDRQPQVGTNIAKTKKEINASLDTINDAFENLLDSLFEDVAWDISSDISVMKTMMEQDGLTDRKLKSSGK